ncbi:MAG: endolytic transglycosylase MltG, partial [Gemmatimonadota bacterium]
MAPAEHGSGAPPRRRARRRSLALLLLLGAGACLPRTGDGTGEPVEVRIRQGASFGEVADTLAAHDIVRWPGLFRQYARFKGTATRIRPGTYAFRAGTGWDVVLDALVEGRILTTKLVLPEGIGVADVAARIAAITHDDPDSLRVILEDTASARRFDVPGPTLEGYLYPSTYDVPVDASAETIIDLLVRTYDDV